MTHTFVDIIAHRYIIFKYGRMTIHRSQKRYRLAPKLL